MTINYTFPASLFNSVHFSTELSVGWVDQWVGLGWIGLGPKIYKIPWVGSGWVQHVVGWVGLGPDLGGSGWVKYAKW
jgi:hypothetical protein